MARLTMRFHYFKNLDMCDRMTQSSHDFGQLFFLDFSITILVVQIEAVFEHWTKTILNMFSNYTFQYMFSIDFIDIFNIFSILFPV